MHQSISSWDRRRRKRILGISSVSSWFTNNNVCAARPQLFGRIFGDVQNTKRKPTTYEYLSRTLNKEPVSRAFTRDVALAGHQNWYGTTPWRCLSRRYGHQRTVVYKEAVAACHRWVHVDKLKSCRASRPVLFGQRGVIRREQRWP